LKEILKMFLIVFAMSMDPYKFNCVEY
jgi:hypothetical protein